MNETNHLLISLSRQVLGLASPASRGGVEEGDLIISIQSQVVTKMAHGEVVNFIKNITGTSMEMSVERGEIVVPNITDCFPIKSEADLEKMTEEERRQYWQEAMKAGLGSRLGPKHFTTVGKMKVHKSSLVQSVNYRSSLFLC